MDRREMPIFVIGCNRSGTTLLRFILDTHPAIACPPESKYLASLPSLFRYPRAVQGLAGLGAGLPELTRQAHLLARSFLDDYASAKGKRRWADKTPDYYRVVEFIDTLFGNQALYLLLVRHPLDVIPSLKGQLTFEMLSGRDDPSLIEAAMRHGTGEYGAAMYWLEVNQRLRVFASCTPERAKIVRFEDVVLNTETTLAEMFAFLGEDFDPSLIEKVFLVDHDRGFEDHRIRGHSRIDRGKVGTWRAWPAPKREALWSLVEPVARQFGYHAAG